MDLVDEQDHRGIGGGLLHHLPHPLLELAPILGTRHQRGQLQRKDLLAPQKVGHAAVGNAGGEPLHDGGLAHTRLSDEAGIVLGLAGQHVGQLQNLSLSPDNGIPLDGGGQVLAVLFQHADRLCSTLGRDGRLTGSVVHIGDQLGLEAAHRYALGTDQPGSHRLRLADQRKEQMLGAHQQASCFAGFTGCLLKNRAESGSHILTVQSGGRSAARQPDQQTAGCRERHSAAGEKVCGGNPFFGDQPQQEVLGADIGVSQLLGKG